MSKPERIVSAANKVTTGDERLDDIYCHIRHNFCFMAMKARRDAVYGDDDSKRLLMIENTEQGFITNMNRFVSRKEGLRIAKEQDQLIAQHGDFLYSEDLY